MTESVPSAVKVKICGVTEPQDAELAIELGADMIGLNFYQPSPRSLERAAAAALIEKVGRQRVTWVGVFVNEDVARAADLADEIGLDLLQFHGDESASSLRPVASRAIKALRVEKNASLQLLEPWLDMGLWGLLIDARHETLYGGSGRGWDFATLASTLEDLDSAATVSTKLLIAGGLGPDNARAAVEAAQPWGIDLASGVESAPGHKDPILMQRLFAQLNEEKPHGTTPTAA